MKRAAKLVLLAAAAAASAAAAPAKLPASTLSLPMQIRALGAGGLAAAALLVAAAGAAGHGPPIKPPRYAGQPVAPGTVATNFTLRDQHGRLVSLAGQRGKIVLLTFLYTHCIDVCPLIAANLDHAVRALGSRASQVTIIAVSVDPKRDTPKAVRSYTAERGVGPAANVAGRARPTRVSTALMTSTNRLPIYRRYESCKVVGTPSSVTISASTEFASTSLSAITPSKS